MPQLDYKQSKKQVFLPSTNNREEDQKLWVVLDTSPMTGNDLLSYDASRTSGWNTVNSLVPRVLEWNIVDEKNVPRIINFDGVRRLELEDIQFLNMEIAQAGNESAAEQGMSVSEKKDASTPSSTPADSTQIQVQTP
jgi:hypothetical protein